MAGAPVQVSVYRWAGAWGPFRIRVPCGECFLTGKVIEDVLANELDGVPVALAVHDWLSGWWKPLPRDLYEMLARVKPLIGASTPVTLPQVFLNGAYVGGAEELGEALNPARETLSGRA